MAVNMDWRIFHPKLWGGFAQGGTPLKKRLGVSYGKTNHVPTKREGVTQGHSFALAPGPQRTKPPAVPGLSLRGWVRFEDFLSEINQIQVCRLGGAEQVLTPWRCLLRGLGGFHWSMLSSFGPRLFICLGGGEVIFFGCEAQQHGCDSNDSAKSAKLN